MVILQLPSRKISLLAAIAGVVIAFSPALTAQTLIITSMDAPPTLTAAKLVGAPPRIDGDLDEAVWQQAAVASNFVQIRPHEGEPASERSEVRVLYGDYALYVAFQAFDSEPEEIEAQLTRRDQGSYSDWVQIAIDSYNDNRTAFQFEVNPKGVKRDSYRFDDTDRDRDWDAVWDVATSVNEEGWSAEFRIPYSQLRFASTEEQTWGIQFMRWIPRKDESSYWAPISGEDNAMVSRFGELRGLDGVEPHRRLEITPYVQARLQRAPDDAANPFYEDNDTFTTAGVDVKYGLTSDLTLDLTVNPDFGQVEADPAEVNLSEFETFFPERRPFFLEGANIFEFGIGDGARLFHSRRIGRPPQGRADPRGGYVNAPDVTTIQTAAKLSGKTESGWTLGVLYAATDEESARVITGDGSRYADIVEPQTQYGVARVQKDFRQGRSAVGLIATGVARDSDIADALNIHANALTVGSDFRHRFGNENYEVTGYLVGSRVEGSAAAIARTQGAAGRYMQRPDADHLTYDPTRTSLQGNAAALNVGKVGGGFWRYGVGLQSRTAEFEANDVGFVRDVDSIRTSMWIGYNHYLPSERLRRWSLNWNTWHAQNYGGERTGLGTAINGNFQFANFWNSWAGLSYSVGSLSTSMLRGGGAMRTEDRIGAGAGFGSDGRKKVGISFNVNTQSRPASDSWSYNLSSKLSWRPSGQVQMSLGAFYNESVNDRQWVTRLGGETDHFIFGRIAQQTLGLTGRLDLAFTPDLSLQLYVQPFVSSGRYDQFKQVANPLADAYAARFDELQTVAVDGGYLSDVDNDGTAEFIYNPDFNSKQFRSNAVLRWEYRPGSTIFAVWSQSRQHFAQDGQFDLGSDLGTLADAPADDVFMLKVSHWLNPTGGG